MLEITVSNRHSFDTRGKNIQSSINSNKTNTIEITLYNNLPTLLQNLYLKTKSELLSKIYVYIELFYNLLVS